MNLKRAARKGGSFVKLKEAGSKVFFRRVKSGKIFFDFSIVSLFRNEIQSGKSTFETAQAAVGSVSDPDRRNTL
jgi:hypothetical protein